MTGGFNRQSVIDLCNGFVPVFAVIILMGMFFGILWNSLVSGIILMIISNIQRSNLPFMQCYTISLYARTPFSLLFAILGALGVIVPFKGFIALVATAVYSSIIIKNLNFDEDMNEFNF